MGNLTWWAIKIIIVVVCAILYRLGGSDEFPKYFRRFLMSGIYVTAINIIALIKGDWSWLLILPLPLYMGSLSLGYGADELWQKILKRGMCGAAVAVSFLPVAFVSGAWSLYALHCIVSISGSILLGTFNQMAEKAEGEEAQIGLMYGLFPIMMI